MARAQGARSQMAAVFETVYGTPPASGYKRMPFASESLGQNQPLIANELVGYGRDPLAPTRDAISVNGDVDVPVDVESFGFWLKGAFGAPATTGTGPGPYTHVFTSGSWVLPSMAIEIGMPEVPHFAMNAGCKVDKLGWTMKRAGNLLAKVGLIAQGEAVAASTAAGTPTDYNLLRFGHFNGQIKRAATVLANVVEADINYMNNLDPIEVIRADGKIAGADPSIAALTGSLKVRFDSQVLLTQATDGSAAAFEFSYLLGTGESLTVAVPKVYLPRPKIAVEGPSGVMATFDWQAAQDTGGDPMVTVTLVNDVASY